ncbi:hypothetical protein [Pseudoalteromonas phenolica]|uniref:Uncharacterized protein n=1 Tax=Pseudoalteromonas phenolica TaxID=161398 RepID=A0A0S2K1U6_9GAMM|nr:hypothetical protein [Pseudoalteromonas phenolica]ALO41938.1 hypothetical protein PP2015_1434 [Pseudoalteromonas phenolica]MBE0353499.1 hypothetical protein [Pseudoalteromonas phenolica O-BC30]RXE94902.1 hypothetical protein D9981_17380 [Pseudoalteromonas phenolica O-BC30]TMO55322.1 hypothetical protein CWC21_11595 [Pseudoalteromonas phenolica]
MYLEKETLNLPIPPEHALDERQKDLFHKNPKKFFETVDFIHASIKYMVDNHIEKINITNKQTIFVYDDGDQEFWIECNKNRKNFKFQLIEPSPILLEDDEYITICKLAHLVRQDQLRSF